MVNPSAAGQAVAVARAVPRLRGRHAAPATGTERGDTEDVRGQLGEARHPCGMEQPQAPGSAG